MQIVILIMQYQNFQNNLNQYNTSTKTRLNNMISDKSERDLRYSLE